MEKGADNMFKIIFGSKDDKDHIFKNRPWSLDGAHLILKPWPDNQVLQDISFDDTTLWLQIHGLPPANLHKGMT